MSEDKQTKSKKETVIAIKDRFGNLEEATSPKATIGEKNLVIGGYIRVSTAKESQRTSLTNQETYLREWAEVNGYRLTRVYKDIKSGAFTAMRNELQEMIADLKAGTIHGVITKEIARTSRDVMDTLELKRTIADHGAFLISIRENYDSRSDDDEFLLIIHAALAQKERKTTAGRVKVTQILKAKQGKGNTPPPYGYRYSKIDPGKYEPHPDEAPVYRLIVDLYLNKRYGRVKIIKHLHSLGIPGPRGGRWGDNAIRIILSNPAYKGTMVYNVTTRVRDVTTGKQKLVLRPESEWVIVKKAHEPLLKPGEWERIQKTIASRRAKDNRAEYSFARKYLLGGLLYCGVCGGKMHGARFRHKGAAKKEYFYYRYVCQGRNAKCDTPSKYYRMPDIDQLVFDECKQMVAIIADPDELQLYTQSQKDLFSKGLEKERIKRETLQVELAKNEKAMLRQQMAYEAEAITLPEYKARLDQLRQQRNALEKKLVLLNQRLSKVDAAQERIKQITSLIIDGYFEDLDNLTEERKRALVEALVSKVSVFPGYKIKIRWAFEDYA